MWVKNLKCTLQGFDAQPWHQNTLSLPSSSQSSGFTPSSQEHQTTAAMRPAALTWWVQSKCIPCKRADSDNSGMI